MRFLILENNIVVNAIYAEQSFIDQSGLIAVQSEKGDIGDEYDGVEFRTLSTFKTSTISPVKPISMRTALMELGVLSTIEDALSQPGNELAQIEFEYGLQFKRDSHAIRTITTLCGLTESAVDAIFVRAMELDHEE